MGRALRPLFALVTLVTTSAGCSFLLLGDYSGGPSSTVADGSDESSSSSSSSGGDTSTNNDGGGGADGGPTDAPSGPFCASHLGVSFCDDFDDPTRPLNIAYDVIGNSGPSDKPKLDTAISVSAPASVVFSTNALPGSDDYAGSRIERSTFQTTSEAHFSCDIQMDSVDPTQAQYFLQFAFGDGGYANKYKVFLYVSGGLPYIAEETPEDDAGDYDSQKVKFSQALPPLGKWWHFDLDISFTLSKLSAKLNGTPVVVDAPMIANHKAGKTQLALGIAYVSGPASAVKVHYDNVLFDVK